MTVLNWLHWSGEIKPEEGCGEHMSTIGTAWTKT